MEVCKRGDESLVRLIVSKGCDVNARDEVLYYLIYFSAVVIVSLQDGRTALYYVAINGHGIIAEYLIKECGANANDEDYVNRRLFMVIVMISLQFLI